MKARQVEWHAAGHFLTCSQITCSATYSNDHRDEGEHAWAWSRLLMAADGARTSELRHIPNMYRWRDRDRSTASDEKTVTGQRWNIITAECNFLPWTRNPIVPLCVTSLSVLFSPSILPSAIWRYPIVWDNKSAWPPRLFFYSLSLLTMTFSVKGEHPFLFGSDPALHSVVSQPHSHFVCLTTHVDISQSWQGCILMLRHPFQFNSFILLYVNFGWSKSSFILFL